MTLYSTIWDASTWDANGGKYKVNYKYAPYIVEFSDFVLHGCAIDPIEHVTNCDSVQTSKIVPSDVTQVERNKMDNFRLKHMTYSYYYDKTRYKVPLPECVIDSREAERLIKSYPVTFGNGRHRRGKRHHHLSKKS
ncbi:hypothetical protein RYX36_008928 [Vicia faba]